MKVDQAAYAEAKAREYGLVDDPGPILPMPPSLRLDKSMVPEDEAQQEARRNAKDPLPINDRIGQLFQIDPTRPSGGILDMFTSE